MKYIGNLVTQFYGQHTPAKRPCRLPTYPIEIILLAAILLKDKLSLLMFRNIDTELPRDL